MKTKIFWICASAAVMFLAPTALRAETPETAAYEACVDQLIVQAERQSGMENSRSEVLRNCAQDAKEKAEYYRVNKAKLVSTMTERRVKAKDTQMRYFLIKAYNERNYALSE